MIKEATYQDKDEVFELINELERYTLDKDLFDKQYNICMNQKHFY